MNKHHPALHRSKLAILLHKLRNTIALGGIRYGVRFLFDRYFWPMVYPKYHVLLLDQKTRCIPMTARHQAFEVIPYQAFEELPPSVLDTIDRFISYSNIKAFIHNFSTSMLWIASFDGNICGYCWSKQYHQDTRNGDRTWKYYLHDAEIFIPFRGKGLGPQMIAAIAEHLYHTYPCAGICARVHVFNHASMNMFKKAGFVVDTGVLKPAQPDKSD